MKEKNKQVEKPDNKKEKSPVPNEILNAAEKFLMRKYKYYLTKTLMDLGNREERSFFFDDEESVYDKLMKKQRQVHELYIEEKQLLHHFQKTMQKENCHNIDPIVFRKTIDSLSGEEKPEEEFDIQLFFMEKIKINKAELLRVTY